MKKKLWIFSDLHLGVGGPVWVPPRIPEADLAIVAGDVGEGLVDTIDWLARTVRPHMPVVVVAGNHEYYNGNSLPEELALGRKAAALQDVVLLQNDTLHMDHCLISGCTLWSDYALDGEAARPAAMRAARVGMRDHARIAWRRYPVFERFRPEEALDLHRDSMRFLTQALGRTPPGKPHVVVSHHAPSPGSIAARYEGDPLNAAFASNLDAFVERTAPTLWVHGHTHTSFDYAISSTRVLCNPKGYGAENRDFDPGLVAELDC